MAISTIYPNGVNEVIVPATQSIAISNFGGGIASIYYLIVNANRPPAYQLQQTLNNSSVVLGAFADGMTIKIEAGPSVVRYDVGASPDTGIGDADTLNGLASDTAATADTIAARDSSGDITANAFESTVATGTAPLTVASTTVVPNLNADLLDGQEGSYYAVNSTVAHLAGGETFLSTMTFQGLIVIDSAGSAQLVLDCNANTNFNTIVFRTNGVDSGMIRYNPDATPANSNLDLFSGGVSTVSMRIGGDGTLYAGTTNTIYHSGTSSASDTFTTADAKTVTVVNGLITSIV